MANAFLELKNDEFTRAEENLQKTLTILSDSENKFKNIISQAPVAIAIFGGSRFIIEVFNDKVLEFWGRTADEVRNKPLFEALPEASGQGFEELLANVLLTGERVCCQRIAGNPDTQW